MTRLTTRTLYPFEWLVLGYSTLMITLLAIFGRPLTYHADEFGFYVGVTLLTLAMALTVDDKSGRWRALIRLGYLAVLFTFFYRNTGGLMDLLYDGFLDDQVVRFEAAVFGTNPTIYFDQNLLGTWINEIMSFSYFSYYFMIPVFLVAVFLRGDYEVLKQSLTAISLTFFASYLLFILYPVEGPRWYFAEEYLNSIEGPLFRPLVEYVINNGAVRGGAMPSSHTGVAIVILMFCFRFYRRAAWWMLPLVVGLAAGTVWGRFHYVSDVIVGAAIAIVATVLARRIHPIGRHDVQGLNEVAVEGSTHVS